MKELRDFWEGICDWDEELREMVTQFERCSCTVREKGIKKKMKLAAIIV
jgi:hypothetical protein